MVQTVKDGGNSVEDDLSFGRPSPSEDKRVEKVRDVFRSNRHLTVQKVAAEIGISEASRYFD